MTSQVNSVKLLMILIDITEIDVFHQSLILAAVEVAKTIEDFQVAIRLLVAEKVQSESR